MKSIAGRLASLERRVENPKAPLRPRASKSCGNPVGWRPRVYCVDMSEPDPDPRCAACGYPLRAKAEPAPPGECTSILVFE